VKTEHRLFGNPLYAAALMSSVEVAAFLLANGADPNPEIVNEPGAIFKTPLHIAAEVVKDKGSLLESYLPFDVHVDNQLVLEV